MLEKENRDLIDEARYLYNINNLYALLDVAQEAEGVAIESMERVRTMIEDTYQAFDDGKKRKKPQERWEGGNKSRSS
jgi:hypothetical protein